MGLTDSNQAEDICPARFFAPSGPANRRINIAGEEERKNHESVDSVQKHNNSASSHRTDARLLWALAASASRLSTRLRLYSRQRVPGRCRARFEPKRQRQTR